MTLARLSLLLAFLALATWAMAGENLSCSQTTSSNADVGSQRSADRHSGADSVPRNPEAAPRLRLLFPGAGPSLAAAADAEDRGLSVHEGVSLATRGDVCYAIRSYKVKPTERIRDYENFSRGYSECEMASNFQIRSAEAHQKNPEAHEPSATLK